MTFDEESILPAGWRQLTVAELVAEGILEKPLDGNHGGIHPKAADYVESGVPFIMASDLVGGRVDLSSCKFITEAQASILRKGFAMAGDVLLSHKATIGRTAIVQDSAHPFIVLTPQVTYYRISDTRQLNAVYLKAYFDSILFQTILGQWAGAGSTRAYLGITGQLKLPIIVPPIDLQSSIARQVGDINDKIQLNHQINQILEQMAQAIFKSWFVDFEPVKAKIAARERWHALQAGNEPASPVCYAGELEGLPIDVDLDTYMNLAAMQAISGKGAEQLAKMRAEQPEEYAELCVTAELFPSAMQDSELGDIPEGWDTSTVGAEFDVTMGQSPPGDTYNECGDGTPFFQGRRDFGVRFPSNRVYCTAPKRMANEGDTLLSVRAPVGDVNIAAIDCCIGRGLAALRHSSGCASFTYYSVLELGHQLASFDSEGTVFGSINQKNLKALEVLTSPAKLIERFSVMVKSVDGLIRSSSQQVDNLSALRDTLLPRLLSGELVL